MNTYNKLLTIAIGILFVPAIFSATAETKVVLTDHSIITGISATAKVTISASDIDTAISNNTPIETDVVANACMFTTHADGDYDLTVTADGNYMQGSNFALYNATLGKINTTLLVASVNDASSIELVPNTATPLQNHSDSQSSGTSCTNQVKFNLRISVAALRTAKAGTYDFGFTTSTSPYSG